MEYELFGRRLRQMRRARNLTQSELAQVASISTSFLAQIEKGSRKASLETLVQLANSLGVSSDALLLDSLQMPVDGQTTDLSPQQRDKLARIMAILLEAEEA